jgi:hypothetical protein
VLLFLSAWYPFAILAGKAGLSRLRLESTPQQPTHQQQIQVRKVCLIFRKPIGQKGNLLILKKPSG